ncbi:MAG: polymer-forming cytoskeletal protein [bacterium]
MNERNDDWNAGLFESEEVGPADLSGSRTRSSVDSDVQLDGELLVHGSMDMNGKFNGQLNCGEVLSIGPEGEATGEIEAVNVVIGGKLEGDLLARKRLEIQSGGSFFGELLVQPEVLVLAETSEFARQHPKPESASSRKVVEMPTGGKSQKSKKNSSK